MIEIDVLGVPCIEVGANTREPEVKVEMSSSKKIEVEILQETDVQVELPRTPSIEVDPDRSAICLRGKDGLSAYEVAVKNGYVGTEQEWLSSLAVKISHIEQSTESGGTSIVTFTDGSELLVKNGRDGRGGGGEGGTEYWDELKEKPFETLGEDFVVDGAELRLNKADAVEQDNTRPITSAAVFAEVGNIAAILAVI